MKILIYVGDMITDLPGIYLGGLIAKRLKAEVTLLHVASKKRGKKFERQEGENILEQARKEFGDLTVKVRYRRGNVAQKILAEVEEKNHDMVVISATRLDGYPRKVSVTRDILPKMPCCALIAKNPKPEIDRILLLTGGIRASEPVIKMGSKLASAVDSRVTLLHVAANVPTMYTGLDTIEETLEELLQTNTPVAKHLRWCARVLTEHKVPSELKLKHGELKYEIIREIDREDYDLVIIGASKIAPGIPEFFVGSVMKDLIDLVGIPVLVVNQTCAQRINDIKVLPN
jgi:nucleotide-binding universal stress UspA family protein